MSLSKQRLRKLEMSLAAKQGVSPQDWVYVVPSEHPNAEQELVRLRMDGKWAISLSKSAMDKYGIPDATLAG